MKRLAAGFAIVGREQGISPDVRRSIIMSCARSYRTTMMEMAEMRAIDVWYAHMSAEVLAESLGKGGKAGDTTERVLTKASGKDSLRALSKLTRIVDGQPRICSDPPLLVPAEELLVAEERERFAEAVTDALALYRESLLPHYRPLFDLYRFRELARKVVGVGSVGSRSWVMLFTGRDTNDPLFMQAKAATASVCEPYVGRSRYRDSGRRVVEGQRFMQGVSDILLGWYHVVGFDGVRRDFYVRQMWDGKGAFDIQQLHESAWETYAHMCAWTLARAHARSGDRIAIAGYLGSSEVFDRAIADFAEAYADQNQRDFEALQAAEASQRIVATRGI